MSDVGPAGTTIGDDVRLGEGGMLRRFETACHLTRLPRQIAFAVAVTWAPMVVLGIASEQLTGRAPVLVQDTAVHVRLLVATPVLLFLDRAFPRLCRFVLGQLTRFGFLSALEQPRFDRTLRSARRMSDTLAPEVVLALLAVGLGAAALLGLRSVSGINPRAGLTAAQVWYALVALPLFEFLLLRSLWRWAIWVRILAGLSRIELALEPTHPDRRGGISFLRLPSLRYCAILLFAATSVLSAEWGGRLTSGPTFASFLPVLLLLAVLAVLVAFGPLLLFAPQLSRAKRDGVLEIGGRVAVSGRSLRRRLLGERDDEEILTSNEIQNQAAVASSYRDTVARISSLLFERRDVTVLLVATLLPLVPLMIARIPQADWLALAGLFTGLP